MFCGKIRDNWYGFVSFFLRFPSTLLSGAAPRGEGYDLGIEAMEVMECEPLGVKRR